MNTVSRQFAISGLVLAIALPATCPALVAADALHITGETMGTYYSIKVDSPAAVDSEDALRTDVTRRLDDINARMSTWDDQSEITKFNQSDSTEWFPVSADFAIVVNEAKRIHALTDGAFDPTLSPLIDLWGFGKPDRSGIPEQAAIDSTMKSIGMQHVEVRTEPPALRKDVATVQLNLSAIAKGYAVDAVAELLTETHRPSFVVDIGGESRLGVAKASGDAWKIGIEPPTAGLQPTDAPLRIIPLTESSIATSGDYRNYFEWKGVRYSHVIDPITGWPVKDPPASVSVIDRSCMTADALATAMMVLSPEKGMALARDHGLSVLFQMLDRDGNIATQATGRFEKIAPAPNAADSTPDKTTKSASSGWIPFAAAAALFLIAMGGMAIGILISNREIKGSCGGLASMPGNDGKSVCELCTIPRDECVNEEVRRQMQASGEYAEHPQNATLTTDHLKKGQP